MIVPGGSRSGSAGVGGLARDWVWAFLEPQRCVKGNCCRAPPRAQPEPQHRAARDLEHGLRCKSLAATTIAPPASASEGCTHANDLRSVRVRNRLHRRCMVPLLPSCARHPTRRGVTEPIGRAFVAGVAVLLDARRREHPSWSDRLARCRSQSGRHGIHRSHRRGRRDLQMLSDCRSGEEAGSAFPTLR